MNDDLKEHGIEIYPGETEKYGTAFAIVCSGIILIVALLSFIRTEYVWVSIISAAALVVFPIVFIQIWLASPEYDLKITINVQGITVTQREQLLAQIPWDSVRDIQVCIEGLQAASIKFTNAGCWTVVISSIPIDTSILYSRTKTLNWTHRIPETWNAPWSLYCGVGFKKDRYALKEQIEAYRKEARLNRDSNCQKE